MNLLEVMTGKEAFEDSNCSVAVWVVPDKIHNNFGSELYLGAAAAKADIPINKHAFIGRYSAWASEARAELGTWNKINYDVAEGMILKVFVHKHLGHGRRTYNCCQYIRVREDAAYRELRIPLTQHPKARFMNAYVKGRFDLLTKEQAEKRGVQISYMSRNMFNPSEVSQLMIDNVIEKQKASPAIIRERIRSSHSGETIIVQSRRKARALDLD